MGQKSSQTLNPTTEQPGEEQGAQTEWRQQKRKTKSKKKEGGAPVNGAGEEEKSALTLLKLRRNALDGDQLLSHEDDFAASTQLILESSPIRPPTSYNIEHGPSERSEAFEDRVPMELRRNKKHKKKGKRHHAETVEEGDFLAARENVAEGPPVKKVKHSRDVVSSTNQLLQPNSALSLDDINSEDEDVASYLQEYENDAINYTSRFSPQTEAIESASQMQQLAATVDHTESNVLRSSPYKLPLNSDHDTNRRDKRKKKGKILPDMGVQLETSYPGNQESLEDIDQPAFDHVAFDNYFNNLPDSVNVLDQVPHEYIPIDPELSQNGIRPAPSENSMMFDREDVRIHKRARRGRSQKVYSSAQKRNSKGELARNNLHNSPQNGPSEFEEHQQDKVLPGIEDMERRSSSRESLFTRNSHSQSEASHRQSEVSDRQPEVSNRESEISDRQSEVSNQESEFSGRQSEVSDRESGISDRQSEVSNRESERSERQSEVSNQESEFSGRQSGVSNSQSERYSPYRIEFKQENTPPPLLKPSRPRGNKRQQGGKKDKNYNPPLKHISEHGGMFTKVEVAKLEKFRDLYCQEQSKTHWQFNELIHENARGNVSAKELLSRLHDQVSYRTRMSVSRFCRRHFHNYSARGTWTNSEDERLGLAVEEKGNLWTTVGAMIGRFPEDCRDRYRNYHGSAENRNREQWTTAEVMHLCKAVYDCMVAVKMEKRKAKEEKYAGREIPESEVESDPEVIETKLIHWASVSDRMSQAGARRSRLQCILKWGKLKSAERRKYWKQVRTVIQGMKPLETRTPSGPSSGWRIRKSLKKIRNMRPGDRYQFLEALSTCGASEAGNIPWLSLGDDDFRAKWTTSDRRAIWIKLKAEVPNADNMDFRQLVNRLLTTEMADGGDRLGERWDPAVYGDINSSGRPTRRERRQRRELQRQQNALVIRGKIKSKEFVQSSDEEEEEDRHTEANNQNQSAEAAGSGDSEGEEATPGLTASRDENSADSEILPDSEAERQEHREQNDEDLGEDEDDSSQEEGEEEEEEEEIEATYGNVSDELATQIQLLAND